MPSEPTNLNLSCVSVAFFLPSKNIEKNEADKLTSNDEWVLMFFGKKREKW